MDDPRVERWLAALVATPGLTATTDLADGRRLHVDDALAAVDLVGPGPIVDVGSGGGSPGIPLAAARPGLHVDLLEAIAKKCAFLRTWAAEFPNVTVVCARAEDHGRGTGRDGYGTAVARALAPPPIALEWCLPLLRPGGRLILYAGAADERAAAIVATKLAATLADVVRVPGSDHRRLLVVEKVGPTPEGFPRRSGVARKRPLA